MINTIWCMVPKHIVFLWMLFLFYLWLKNRNWVTAQVCVEEH